MAAQEIFLISALHVHGWDEGGHRADDVLTRDAFEQIHGMSNGEVADSPRVEATGRYGEYSQSPIQRQIQLEFGHLRRL